MPFLIPSSFSLTFRISNSSRVICSPFDILVFQRIFLYSSDMVLFLKKFKMTSQWSLSACPEDMTGLILLLNSSSFTGRSKLYPLKSAAPLNIISVISCLLYSSEMKSSLDPLDLLGPSETESETFKCGLTLLLSVTARILVLPWIEAPYLIFIFCLKSME